MPTPTHRYQTVDGLAADLARFRDQEPVGAYRESPVERLIRVYRRYELPILLLMAYVVMRFVLLVWAGNLTGVPDEPCAERVERVFRRHE